MADWPAFAAFAGVVLLSLLALARLSQPRSDGVDADGGATGDYRTRPPETPRHPDGFVYPLAEEPPGFRQLGDLSPGELLANVAISQGVFAALLVAAVWYTEVPAASLGLSADVLTPGMAAVGVALGVALYLANEAGATVGRRFGLGGGEEFREQLAPETAGGWAVLLLVVLPTVAGFEELLFRGALVGALGAGFGISPWALAVVSSGAFALGHGAQGPAGIAVTGVLGFALAAAFVTTESLLVVVVAHYLVNALEFVVHETPIPGAVT